MLIGISGSKQVRSWSQTMRLTSSSVAPGGSSGARSGSLPIASPSAPAMRNRLPST